MGVLYNMAILERQERRTVIDLTGPDGNAFYLLGFACNLMRDLEFTPEEAEGVMNEMRSSDYENLIRVFDHYFGEFVDLER